MTETSSSTTLSVLKTVANLGSPYEVIKIDHTLADTALFCKNIWFPDGEVREHDLCGIQEETIFFCGMCGSGYDSVGCKQACTQTHGCLKGILCICMGNGVTYGWRSEG